MRRRRRRRRIKCTLPPVFAGWRNEQTMYAAVPAAARMKKGMSEASHSVFNSFTKEKV